MKYAERLISESVPQWAIYNIEYNKLKDLIKIHITNDQVQAIAISRQDDIASKKFEDLFFSELCNQHDCADLFVKSKAGEISRRLRECGREVKLLSRFVDAQRIALHRILKKYRKWSGSQTLDARFKHEVFSNPKSFINCNFEPLVLQYNDILTALHASTLTSSELVITTTRSEQPSFQTPVQEVQQTYWNEYDNGSEAENEPYTLNVGPEAELIFPGVQTMIYVISRAKVLMEKVNAWQNLLKDGSYFTKQANPTERDIGEDNCSSSSNLSVAYAMHYATFPSTSDQRPSQYCERLLFQGGISGFVIALLLLVAGILILTDIVCASKLTRALS
ncbi:hypothetical protein F5884DRAFT_856642 [Xylogone sp. PMI_703]|nr:hypothetical protein F5884DRAFT_856642 [Xylogone sp. PMI_703]